MKGKRERERDKSEREREGGGGEEGISVGGDVTLTYPLYTTEYRAVACRARRHSPFFDLCVRDPPHSQSRDTPDGGGVATELG